MAPRLVVFALLSLTSAIRLIESNSLDTCMQNSQLVATSFNAVFTPNNQSLAFHIEGNSQVSSDVVLDLRVSGYGYTVASKVIYPCSTLGMHSMCPMNAGQLPDMVSNVQLPAADVSRVPSSSLTSLGRI
jgi:ML-like domain